MIAPLIHTVQEARDSHRDAETNIEMDVEMNIEINNGAVGISRTYETIARQ